MTRRLGILLVGIAAAVAIAAASTDSQGGGRRYVVELDNAFGLVVLGDVRVAGVNAGKVREIELDKRTKKALVEIEVEDEGFGSFRSDARCESRPQSPLGEFFVDCQPGTSRKEIPEGGRVPVSQTASTIPPDLITNIMRRPFRERLRLILGELGAGLAGRPDELNAAIRRAVPALRQSSRLLAVLADHNRTIRELIRNADRVVGRLADNKADVGRFVEEARDTSSASAERQSDIATNFRRLPTFLQELRPTMAALERTAREERPVLVDLNASAGELTRFMDLSAELSDASRPSLRALGDAAPVGRQAVRAAAPRVRELRDYAKPTTDVARNLAIVLEDFDDPRKAVEPNPLSPRGGRGYAGTEALLQYIVSQTLQTNAFDELGHVPRVTLVQSHCGPYQNAQSLKDNYAALKDCRAWLGPSQPGVTTDDPTASPDQETPPVSPSSLRDTPPRSARSRARGGTAGTAPGGAGGDRSAAPQDGLEAELDRILDQVLGDVRPAPTATDQIQALDFLLSP
ncbi:MAG TPA: MlaD family protein [Thermoleophilaceae bacterium]|jgi:ABC-type transporter Mla subunit MlaD